MSFFQSLLSANATFDVIWIIGDSIARGNSDAVGPTPIAGTVYQWDDGNGTIREITNTDLLEPIAVGAGGSQWPSCGIKYYSLTGRRPMFVDCGIGGSAFRNPTPGFSWYTDDTLYSNAVTKLENCLTYLGKTEPDHIYINLGINDVVQGNALTPTNMTSLIDRIVADYPGVQIHMTMPYMIGLATYADLTRLFTVRKYLKALVFAYTDVRVCMDNYPLALWGGNFQVDNIHLNSSGNAALGERIARGLCVSSSLHKYTGSIISTLFDEISNTRRGWLDTFITTINTAGLLSNLDILHVYGGCNGSDKWKNAIVDWAFNVSGSAAGTGVTSNFGDAYFSSDGSDDRISTAPFSLFSDKAAAQTDFIAGAFVGTVTTAAGTAAALIGVRESVAGGIILLRQNATSQVDIFGCSTAATVYGTDTKFANDSHYAVYRTSGTQGLVKNAASVASASVASAALNPGTGVRSMQVAAYNANATVQNYIQAQIKGAYVGKYSVWDLTAFYNAFNTLWTDWSTSVS